MCYDDSYAEQFAMQNKLVLIVRLCMSLVPVVGEIMEDFYPEVKEKQDFIERVIKNEEERFHETLHEGLAILSDVIKKAKGKRKQTNSWRRCFPII